MKKAKGPRRKSTDRKKGKQLNALVSPELYEAMNDHCRVRSQKRDKTVEAALWRYLRAEASEHDGEFHVTLSRDVATRLSAFRRLRQMPDRNLLLEEALLRHIDATIGPADRETFTTLVDQLRRSEPN
jgi:hypothetical protein